MRDSTRLLGTLIIWIGFAATVSVVFTTATGPMSHASEASLIVITGIFALMAMISTLAVWFGGGQVGSAAYRDAGAHRKTKRRGSERIRHLIESLDDDEIYDLEAHLLARDHSAAGGNGGPHRHQDI